MSGGLDRWMDDLRFYVLFNSISVISGQWADDNEILCAMKPRLQLRNALEEHDGKVSIGGRNITNLRFADDIDSIAEDQQELL